MLPVTQTKEERRGITKGTLLKWKGIRVIPAYGMEWLDKPCPTGFDGRNDPFQARRAECMIGKNDLVMYVRRVGNVATCWIVYCFKVNKNVLVFNKHFMSYSEIVAKPDEP